MGDRDLGKSRIASDSAVDKANKSENLLSQSPPAYQSFREKLANGQSVPATAAAAAAAADVVAAAAAATRTINGCQSSAANACCCNTNIQWLPK